MLGTRKYSRRQLLTTRDRELPATSGEVLLNGVRVAGAALAQGAVFFWDEPHLIASFTCREMIEYWIALHQPAPRPGLALHVLEQLALASLADRVVSRGLSDGERRRLALGAALVSGCPVLLLDEPTSGLSAADALQVCRLLSYVAPL